MCVVWVLFLFIATTFRWFFSFDYEIVDEKVNVYSHKMDLSTSGYVIYSSFSNTKIRSGSNIDLWTVFSSSLKWIAHNETDLYTCEIIVLNAIHWCKNANPSKCNF